MPFTLRPFRLRTLLAVIFVVLAWPVHASETASPTEQYLCVVDKASGFAYDQDRKQWKAAAFNPDKKYLISESIPPSKGFHVTELGQKKPLVVCDLAFVMESYLQCEGLLHDFLFNKSSGRFLHIYSYGYYNVPPDLIDTPDESNDTPLLEIGKCSRF
jgi:hypothetical protein